MKPIGVWGWFGGHDGQRPMGKFGQDAKVTSLLSLKDMGFLMMTKNQDWDVRNHTPPLASQTPLPTET